MPRKLELTFQRGAGWQVEEVLSGEGVLPGFGEGKVGS